MLSGDEIFLEIERGNIVIDPFDSKNMGPNSYYLHLGDELVVYEEDVLDCKKVNKTRSFKIPEEGFVLQPGELYLSRTLEYTETHKHIPLLNGRFSLGALGVTIHITAGFGDVGFRGTWTLEIFCIKPIRIYPRMKFCKICYFPPVGSDRIKYQGKYLGQRDTTASKLYKDFENVK